jgi:hypothetical protein
MSKVWGSIEMFGVAGFEWRVTGVEKNQNAGSGKKQKVAKLKWVRNPRLLIPWQLQLPA